MTDLTSFRTCFDAERGRDLPLPKTLASVYGNLNFPLSSQRPYVISNFVSSLDGVVTLNIPGHESGGDISGFNQHDHLLMGILRAAADAVIVGASQLRKPPGAIWIPDLIAPAFADAYQQFRKKLGKTGSPLQVILTASGRLDFDLPIFQSGKVPVLILTTEKAAEAIVRYSLPKWVRVVAMVENGHLSAGQVLKEVWRVLPGSLYLIEGGPTLVRYFFKEHRLDELFLTLAPQVAGREDDSGRKGFAQGAIYAPENPLWGILVGVKQAASHLFLRYAFETTGWQDIIET